MSNRSQSLQSVIVLSAHNTGLGVIRALGEKKIPIIAVYYEKRDSGYVSKYVVDKVFAPHPEESETRFINLLIDLSKRYGNSILIPADDATLVAISKNKDQLANYHTVACNEWAISQRIVKKKYTYKLAESLGIPIPQTVIPQNIKEVEQYSASTTYPCLVKPSESHRYFRLFGRKMRKVFNANELMSAYKQASNAGLDVLLQEYIPGEDSNGANYNSYYWKNEAVAEFTAKKVRLSPLDLGVPCVLVSKHIPELLSQGQKILQALGYNGYSCMEFKKDDRDGMYKFLEINGRHNRSTLLAVKCGINFPLIEYNHLVQNKDPSSLAVNFRKQVYWIDLTKDIIAGVQFTRNKRFSIIQAVKPYLKAHVFAVLCIKDPMPFIKRCKDGLCIACRAIFKLQKRRRTIK